MGMTPDNIRQYGKSLAARVTQDFEAMAQTLEREEANRRADRTRRNVAVATIILVVAAIVLGWIWGPF